MKTLKNKAQNLCVIIENETVYLVNVNFTKIYKQFGLSTFNSVDWSNTENPTEKRLKGLKNRFKHEQINKKLIDKKQSERIERSKKTTVKYWIDQRLQSKLKNKLENLAACLPEMGYSMGSKYQVCLLTLFTGNYSDCSEYAKSCKFRATHGNFTLKISVDEFKNAENIGGIFTYIYPNQKRKVKKCWWYVSTGQKNNYQIAKKHGYIFEGFHGETYEAAKKGGERNIQAKKAELIRKKQNEKQKEQAEKNYKKALRLQYSYSDSLKVNCEPGTKAFILRCGLDASKQYRGSFLVKVATEKSPLSLPFVKRMICSNC